MPKVGTWREGSDGERIQKYFDEWWGRFGNEWIMLIHTTVGHHFVNAVRNMAAEAFFVAAGGELRREVKSKQGAVMERMHVRRVQNGWVIEKFTAEGGDRSVSEIVVLNADPAKVVEEAAYFVSLDKRITIGPMATTPAA